MKTFAIVGLGFIAPRHKQAIERVGGVVTMVCDIEPEKYTDEWKGAEFVQDYRHIDGVDYVTICTPNHLHLQMAQYFTAKGIKVLVEKPPVISSDMIPVDNDIDVVLQLHHHPEVIRLSKEVNDFHVGSVVVKVKRDQSYWDGWKGDELRSGGILFNLAVHYIELLIHLFGDKVQVIESHYTPKKAYGRLGIGTSVFSYHFEIMDTAEGQTRTLVIDDVPVELSNKDNLSYEDLHWHVYESLLDGGGVKIHECKPVIELIEKLKESV